MINVFSLNKGHMSKSKYFIPKEFWSISGGPQELTLHRNKMKKSFECQGDCYPWHVAQFNFPSDGHKISDRYKKKRLSVKIFKFCCKDHTPANTAKYQWYQSL